MSAFSVPHNPNLASQRRALVAFYRRHRRDLPWRRRTDPYAIWVSEIMLQQTQVDTVVPRYVAFLQQFPSLAALAAASEQGVCEAWAGLGYYRRARYLHAAAREVMARHGGQLPADVKALRQLPGIGRYTAGAIASIAFGLAEPVVDGNVERVLARLHGLAGSLQTAAAKRQIWALAEQLVVGSHPGDLNQALMELGATTCTPHKPRCALCPLRTSCRAWALGDPTRFPAAAKPVVRQQLRVAFAFATGRQGLWLARRDLTGLWAGLWELPSALGEQAEKVLADQLAQPLGRPLVSVRHTLTHREVQAWVYHLQPQRWRQRETLRMVAEPLAAPLSALARKAIIAAQRALSVNGP